MICFFKTDFFNFVSFERQTKLPSADLLPQMYNSQGCAKPRPGAWNPVQAPHVMAGIQPLGPLPLTPRVLLSRKLEWETQLRLGPMYSDMAYKHP